MQWVDSQPADDLYITAVTAAELMYGLARMPDGRRKSDLAIGLGAVIHQDFADRTLPFDHHAAEHFARPVDARDRAGGPISAADAQIAAICVERGAALSTRNVKGFDGVGVRVTDPWQLGSDH